MSCAKRSAIDRRRFAWRLPKNKKPDRLQSDPTVIPQTNNAETTASIALHKNFVTVRQIFSDDPAPQIQAFTELRRSPLSSPAAAWPCRQVLLNPAPLSRRFSFSTSYHRRLLLSIAFFVFIIIHNMPPDFKNFFVTIPPSLHPNPAKNDCLPH